MFDTVRSLSRSKLAALKTGTSATSTLYAMLLETPHGRFFEQSVGDDDGIRQFAFLAATSTIEAEDLVSPLYASGGTGGASGASTTPLPPEVAELGTGVDCLPSSVNGADLTLRNKLTVLNCLVFSTPHSFWVEQSTRTKETNALKASGRYDWLGYEKWDCTAWLDGPVPSCLKHDVTWASLRKFEGGDESDDPIDSAWNPRNKYLADEKFFADIKRNGCQNPTWNAEEFWCDRPSIEQAFIMQFGVRVINSKDWPYTDYDLEHINSNYGFAEYDIPNVTNVSVSQPSDGAFAVSWTYSPGTVSAATVRQYKLCWEIPSFVLFGSSSRKCKTAGGDALSHILNLLIGSARSFKSIEIWPDNRLAPTFGGLYYPPQEFSIAYE